MLRQLLDVRGFQVSTTPTHTLTTLREDIQHCSAESIIANMSRRSNLDLINECDKLVGSLPMLRIRTDRQLSIRAGA